MLEKQARDLARELNDSQLDQFRSRDEKRPEQKKTLSVDPQAIGIKKPVTNVRQSAELPFIKYKAEKYKTSEKILNLLGKNFNH